MSRCKIHLLVFTLYPGKFRISPDIGGHNSSMFLNMHTFAKFQKLLP